MTQLVNLNFLHASTYNPLDNINHNIIEFFLGRHEMLEHKEDFLI
jgi:hypothetical protein